MMFTLESGCSCKVEIDLHDLQLDLLPIDQTTMLTMVKHLGDISMACMA